MPIGELSDKEKDSLTKLARQMVERGLRTADALAIETTSAGAEIDPFSPAGVSVRLARLEEKLSDQSRVWNKNLQVVLFGLERLETSCSLLRGEVAACRQALDEQKERTRSHEDNLKQSAMDFVEEFTERLDRRIEQVRDILAEDGRPAGKKVGLG